MQLEKFLLALALFGLLSSAPAARAQAAAESDDGNSNGIENDGGAPGAENDGNDGDDTSIGANPPNALIGCLSPYTYIDSQEGLALAKGLIDNSGLQEVLKYRNTSGTFLVPTNNALRNLQTATLNLSNPESLSAPLIRSIIQYHLLFDTIDPATLASLTEATPYDTTLYLAADGSNGGLALSPQEVLVRQATTTYENVTVSVTPLPTDSSENAPNGTYRVTAANSAGNIIWDATNEPVRTCVGYIYKVDGVLLPATNINALTTGALAPSPGAPEAQSDDGAGVDAPGQASDDGGDVSNEGGAAEGDGSESEGTASD